MNQAAVRDVLPCLCSEVVAPPWPELLSASTRSPCTARATTPRWSATSRSLISQINAARDSLA